MSTGLLLAFLASNSRTPVSKILQQVVEELDKRPSAQVLPHDNIARQEIGWVLVEGDLIVAERYITKMQIESSVPDLPLWLRNIIRTAKGRMEITDYLNCCVPDGMARIEQIRRRLQEVLPTVWEVILAED